MKKISQEKLAKYRKLGEKSVWDIKNPQARAIFQRLEEEGCSFDDWAFNPHWGMFHAPHSRDMENVDIVCVGIPMENTIPERPGTKYGPTAVRKWSHIMGPIHHITDVVPFDMCSIVDYGDIDFTGFDLKERIDNIYQTFLKFKESNISTLSVGGEHTMTYPILKAHGRDEPLAMIHLDAHADTTGNIGGGDVSDANGFRHAVMDGVLDPERTIQIGIRGRAWHFWDFSHDTGMRVVSAEDFQERGVKAMVEEARALVGNYPCYLTIDNDALDPSCMPGTGLPEPFGLTSREVRDFIRGLRGLNIVGVDIAEICPPADPTEISANTGAALCFEMLCLLCEAHVARTGVARKTHWNPEPAKETS